MGANVPVASPRPSAGHFLLPYSRGAGQPLAEVFERDAGTSGENRWPHEEVKTPRRLNPCGAILTVSGLFRGRPCHHCDPRLIRGRNNLVTIQKETLPR